MSLMAPHTYEGVSAVAKKTWGLGFHPQRVKPKSDAIIYSSDKKIQETELRKDYFLLAHCFLSMVKIHVFCHETWMKDRDKATMQH